MEWHKRGSDFVKALSKYRYAILILVIGLGLMLIPGQKPNSQPMETQTLLMESPQEQLSQILAQVKGAGRVEVILSIAQGEQVIYQTDQRTSEDAGRSEIRIETVILSNRDRGEEALVTQVHPPKYLGAVILCQGAADPTVRLAMVDAVCKFTGLGADKISILEMK